MGGVLWVFIAVSAPIAVGVKPAGSNSEDVLARNPGTFWIGAQAQDSDCSTRTGEGMGMGMKLG